MSKMLVVIDMQKNFIIETGAERIVQKVAEKIKQRAREGYEIIFTLDKAGGSPDEEIVSACGGVKVFKKRSYGCEQLISYLKEREPSAVEFVGICTDICVVTNVLSAITVLPSSKISVDGGCCATHSLEGHNCAIRVMKSCNVDII